MEQKDHFVGIEMVRVHYVLLSITLFLAVKCLCRSSFRAAIALALCCNTDTHTNLVTCMAEATVTFAN